MDNLFDYSMFVERYDNQFTNTIHMKKSIYQLTSILCLICVFASCGAKSAQQKVSEEPQTDNVNVEKSLVGNDRDDHGCIASAGYQWSELLQDCIRPFEKGTRLKSTHESTIVAAYLVFNADSSKVELYLPKEKSHPILNRKVTIDKETIWIGANEDSWSVRYIEKIWGIYFNDELKYVKY